VQGPTCAGGGLMKDDRGNSGEHGGLNLLSKKSVYHDTRAEWNAKIETHKKPPPKMYLVRGGGGKKLFCP